MNAIPVQDYAGRHYSIDPARVSKLERDPARHILKVYYAGDDQAVFILLGPAAVEGWTAILDANPDVEQVVIDDGRPE